MKYADYYEVRTRIEPMDQDARDQMLLAAADCRAGAAALAASPTPKLAQRLDQPVAAACICPEFDPVCPLHGANRPFPAPPAPTLDVPVTAFRDAVGLVAYERNRWDGHHDKTSRHWADVYTKLAAFLLAAEVIAAKGEDSK